MSFFNVTVKGLESIDKDFSEQVTHITTKVIPQALTQVGYEMAANLQKHIKNDWYKPWKPKTYPRRTDNPNLGMSIMDKRNMSFGVSNTSLHFFYTPNGEHADKKYHTRDGDELIQSIQEGKLHGNPPPRPFWNNFVDEQINSAISREFGKSIKEQGYKYKDTKGSVTPGNEKL